MPAYGTQTPRVLRDEGQPACSIRLVRKKTLESVLQDLSAGQRAWVEAHGYAGKPGKTLIVPNADGSVATVLYGAPSSDPYAAFEPSGLHSTLPKGQYRFEGEPLDNPDVTALGWALDGYRFDAYSEKKAAEADLLVDDTIDLDDLARVHAGVTFARDLVNMPANALGPAELADAALALADTFNAKGSVITGAALLDNNFPLVHAVGAASDRAPRLIDFSWGDEAHPKLTLVGKGVCFDSGGLNLKPGNAMEVMKKDMGGAANVLGLASMIMAADLPVRLRVLIPAVENAISGSAFRPGDVFKSRKGLTVEIGNTDAEGRLILADALALADAEEPDLLIDMATLTGAARVATGPDLPPIFTDDDAFAEAVCAAGLDLCDPVWRLPLWKPYSKLLSSKVADVNHISAGPFAGAITAALFLKRFVGKSRTWAHFDIHAWMPSAKPARPQGGAAQAIRALYHVIRERYAASADR